MDVRDLLQQMVDLKAADLFITAGAPVSVKKSGSLQPLENTKILSSVDAEMLVFQMMNEKQHQEFTLTHECNFALHFDDIGRFRANVYKQKNNCAAVIRAINTKIPNLTELQMPDIIRDFAMLKRGLVLFVGATGAGKSSTLAAMLDYRNKNSCGHIITIEDPIEFVHEHQKSIITQREIGIDTESLDIALKNTLRQSPDVILIGEIRTKDTLKHALAFAETGHLCLATLHASNANESLDRIASFFDSSEKQQMWMDLSLNLKAVVAQQLVPLQNSAGCIAAVEILINTPVIAKHIKDGQIDVIKEFISRGKNQGMQTFDQALLHLYSAKKISYSDAIKHADSANELKLMIKLSQGINGDAGAGLSMSDNLNLS